MITKTVGATYEKGVLKLDEPVDLATSSRVRVKIEIPEPERPAADARRQGETLALSPEKRDLLERVRRLRDRIPLLDFDIVGALRDIRENG